VSVYSEISERDENVCKDNEQSYAQAEGHALCVLIGEGDNKISEGHARLNEHDSECVGESQLLLGEPVAQDGEGGHLLALSADPKQEPPSQCQ